LVHEVDLVSMLQCMKTFWTNLLGVSCLCLRRSPRMREGVQRQMRRGPRVLVCFRLGILHAVGSSVWVQQHCGVRSCTAVALFGAVVPAPLLLISGDLLLRSDTCGPAGGSCGCFLSPASALCVVPGRVDDPIRRASEFLER
jgi:hypothetical protein